jgi:diguanylate cyclase (GGDEF)-like protein
MVGLGGLPLKFVVDQERCVGCLACARVCPTGAIAVPAEHGVVSIMDDACIRCGQCLPACPHDAIDAMGMLQQALALAGRRDTVLILGTEAPAHFYPATAEQVVNACYAAGFPLVSRGVLGDELVAEEYLRLWGEEGWGTMIRSSDPVVVGAIGMDYPELIPYLAPIVTPPVAEARYLQRLAASELRVVYAGPWPVNAVDGLDATLTFDELEQLFRLRGVNVLAQPTVFSRVPMERRRHLSVAGGFPSAWLTPGGPGVPRLHRIRGLEGLKALSRALVTDRLELGFVDLLSCEGGLDHPAIGPRELLLWRRTLVQHSEPPRSRDPVVDPTVRASVGATFRFRTQVPQPDLAAVKAVLEQIGTGPNGRPWDCGACGFATCAAFAEAVARGRSSLRLCPPHLTRWAEESQRAAATDLLTGLATFRVLRDRLSQEQERSKRSGERFAALFLDLDRLKDVNDQHGHEAGNEVLRAVSAEIRSAIRATDLAARYGGDEFVVILTRTDLPGATRVAEALRAGVERVGQRLGYGQGAVTVSIGIAEYDPAQPPAGDLLVDADRALYRAKAAGRNKVIEGTLTRAGDEGGATR